uniref:Uncharacterized protein n=1 Tax=Arundo donax TaxID=35708 RepID=A0A0A9BHR3_ARUDO
MLHQYILSSLFVLENVLVLLPHFDVASIHSLTCGC